MSNFENRVFGVVCRIPKGKTLTYKQVAQKAGRPNAYRAVGNILNKNYNKEIPCHRVVRGDGQIGGYNRGAIQKEELLRREFYERPALKVARDLLGKTLVRSFTGAKDDISCVITEVEAYIGSHDKACHAHKGLTPRTKIMFGPAGHWYVYFTYGMHWLLNIVTGKEGQPAAVLIRGTDKISGPARLTKYLGIDKKINGQLASPKTGLWIANGEVKISPLQIKRTSRIGVAYAKEWADKPYRFLYEQNRGT